MQNVNFSYIVEEYKKCRSMYKVIDEHAVYLECGMEMELPLIEKRGDNKRVMHEQVTIRDIKIRPQFQRKGMFTEFVRWLLAEKGIAVSLESVQPKWLKDRLFASEHWVLQTPEDCKDWCPVYVRFPSEKDKKDFILF